MIFSARNNFEMLFLKRMGVSGNFSRNRVTFQVLVDTGNKVSRSFSDIDVFTSSTGVRIGTHMNRFFLHKIS